MYDYQEKINPDSALREPGTKDILSLLLHPFGLSQCVEPIPYDNAHSKIEIIKEKKYYE